MSLLRSPSTINQPILKEEGKISTTTEIGYNREKHKSLAFPETSMDCTCKDLGFEIQVEDQLFLEDDMSWLFDVLLLVVGLYAL